MVYIGQTKRNIERYIKRTPKKYWVIPKLINQLWQHMFGIGDVLSKMKLNY